MVQAYCSSLAITEEMKTGTEFLGFDDDMKRTYKSDHLNSDINSDFKCESNTRPDMSLPYSTKRRTENRNDIISFCTRVSCSLTN